MFEISYTDKIYTIDEIKELVAPVAARYDIEAIYLFGSYARGEAKANSDIDLRVEASRIKSLMTFGGLYSELEEALAKKPDLLTTKNPDGDFLEELEKDEVLIYVPRGKYLRPMLRIKGDSLSTVPR
ncbi:nucleotidyltransferase domain-containing protein [Cloacibacillus sp.]|uniref:nucleotidyltransferase family protein n=1 Tax=Cloacibacillus sp. TaxID=2049023 RepID=UPI0025C6D66B|nr:nucleotidyltransferase domain-containing protein [Cloacibacillus sp.]MCC8057615.1 nucleotidyltransferase domain-containing protein [Cloacibacillus sp.]